MFGVDEDGKHRIRNADMGFGGKLAEPYTLGSIEAILFYAKSDDVFEIKKVKGQFALPKKAPFA